MFDIGFTEMMLIAVVALVVIGPERLPKVARTIGHLFGRAQRYVSDVKTEINREIEIDELRRLQAEMQTAARKFEGDVQKSMNDAESSFKKETTKLEAELNEQPGAGHGDSLLEQQLDAAEAEVKRLKELSDAAAKEGQAVSKDDQTVAKDAQTAVKAASSEATVQTRQASAASSNEAAGGKA